MLSTFLARYDARLLQPPRLPVSPAGPGASTGPAALPPPERDVQQQLLAWCRAGLAGSAPTLSIALLTGLPDDGRGPCALVEDAALQLDGTYALLAAGGRWRQRLFRLRVKARECLPIGTHAADAVWDSGHLIDSADARAHLPRFQPRRPTLLVAQGLAGAALRDMLRTLAARPSAWPRPVRLLVLAATPPAALAAATIADGPPFSRGPLSFQVLRAAVA